MHYNIIICIINTTFVFYLHDSVLINELTKYNHRIFLQETLLLILLYRLLHEIIRLIISAENYNSFIGLYLFISL